MLPQKTVKKGSVKGDKVFPKGLRRPRILMVEDNPFFRKIFRNRLVDAGFDFTEATNGDEGLNKFYSKKPDLVLLDLLLPGKNGFEVLSNIRRKKEYKNTPIIILSVLGQQKDIERGLSLGANDYLIKANVSLNNVVKKVNEWLIKSRIEK